MNRIAPSGFIFVSTHAAEPPELIPVRHIVRVIPRGDSALLVLSNDDRVPVIESLAIVAERIAQTTHPLHVLKAPVEAPVPYPWTPVAPPREPKIQFTEAPHEDLLQPLRKTRMPPTPPCAQPPSTGPCFVHMVWQRRVGPYESAAEARAEPIDFREKEVYLNGTGTSYVCREHAGT